MSPPNPAPPGTLREIALELSKTVQCRCDLDRWQPENDTGHSWVCPIHKEAKAIAAIPALLAREPKEAT